MKKLIEDAAREYALDKVKGMSRARDEASEGFEEWYGMRAILRMVINPLEAWQAAKLSSQKEIKEMSNELDKAGNNLFLQEGKIKELEKEVENYEINILKVMKQRDELEEKLKLAKKEISILKGVNP